MSKQSVCGPARRRDRGAAAVEFAIILPLLLLVIAGVVDLGRALYTQVTLTNAAREGARAAVVGTKPGDIEVRAKAAIPAGPLKTAANVATVPSGGCAPDQDVTVTIRAPFDWMLLGPAMNFFGGSSVLPPDFESSATMRCGG